MPGYVRQNMLCVRIIVWSNRFLDRLTGGKIFANRILNTRYENITTGLILAHKTVSDNIPYHFAGDYHLSSFFTGPNHLHVAGFTQSRTSTRYVDIKAHASYSLHVTISILL